VTGPTPGHREAAVAVVESRPLKLLQIPFALNCVKLRVALEREGLAFDAENIVPADRSGVIRQSRQRLVPEHRGIKLHGPLPVRNWTLCKSPRNPPPSLAKPILRPRG